MSFINWLKKPYFFNPSPKNHLTLAFGVGFFIFIFLYTFQPFGMSELKGGLFFYCLGFGGVTFFIQTLLFVFVPLVFKDLFNDENWTIGKNILFLFILILSISISNWFYNTQVQNTESWRLLTLKEIFSYTFIISIFPVFIFTYLSEKKYVLKNQNNNKKTFSFNKLKEQNNVIKIYGDNNKEYISFKIDDLIYISSQGNYASFYLYSNNIIEEKVIRNTLTNIITHIKQHSNIIRCHKSYIANAKFMDSISGNARGYFLESKLIDIQIPISRSFKKEELKNLIS